MMKWRITEPQPQRSKNETTAPASLTEVEVPESVRQQRPRPGETFLVSVRRLSLDAGAAEKSQAEQAALGSSTKEFSCSFIGDGKSLKIGDCIVRLARSPQAQKKGMIRIRAGVMDVVKDYVRLVERVRPVAPLRAAHALGGGDLCAPMTGKVIKVNVAKDQAVAEGECLVVIEAMKMENQIRSECDGVIRRIQVSEGESVKVGDVIVTVEGTGTNGVQTAPTSKGETK